MVVTRGEGSPRSAHDPPAISGRPREDRLGAALLSPLVMPCVLPVVVARRIVLSQDVVL